MVEQPEVQERVDRQHMVVIFWGGGDIKDAQVGKFAGGVIAKDLVEKTTRPIHHRKPRRHSRALVDCGRLVEMQQAYLPLPEEKRVVANAIKRERSIVNIGGGSELGKALLAYLERTIKLIELMVDRRLINQCQAHHDVIIRGFADRKGGFKIGAGAFQMRLF